TFHYGSALAIGGGGYDRGAAPDVIKNVVAVSGGADLTAALATVAAGGGVEIADSRRYATPATIAANVPPAGPADTRTVLRAANRQRPLLSRDDHPTP